MNLGYNVESLPRGHDWCHWSHRNSPLSLNIFHSRTWQKMQAQVFSWTSTDLTNYISNAPPFYLRRQQFSEISKYTSDWEPPVIITTRSYSLFYPSECTNMWVRWLKTFLSCHFSLMSNCCMLQTNLWGWKRLQTCCSITASSKTPPIQVYQRPISVLRNSITGIYRSQDPWSSVRGFPLKMLSELENLVGISGAFDHPRGTHDIRSVLLDSAGPLDEINSTRWFGEKKYIPWAVDKSSGNGGFFHLPFRR